MAKSSLIPLSRTQSLWLLGSLFLVILPAWERVPVWTWGFVFGSMIWFWRCRFANWYAPEKWSRLALTLLMVTLIYFKYGTILGKDPGVVLLSGMLALKLLEIRTRKDILLVLFLSYFLLTTNFLFSQSIELSVYLAICVYVVTVTLIKISLPNNIVQTPWYGVKIGLQMLIYSIPLALVMFFLFPRLHGPLWGLQLESAVASTGLSDSISPGSISSMIRNPDIAFRAKFSGQAPSQGNLYWRGLVLWNYDGRSWTMGPQRNIIVGLSATNVATHDYRITLEPTLRRWLFTLDRPLQAGDRSPMTSSLELFRDKPVMSTYSYSVRSAPAAVLNSMNARERNMGLALPDGLNTQTRELIRSWQTQGLTKNEIAQQALFYFSKQPFYYSLKAPVLGENAVDDFLFNTRKGFCEHYASSYSVMMRLAGIPSRVVVGYQGGELNPVGDYYIIRQSDAHAWVEIWLQDQGWVRIDPTAAVAPQRIEQGVEASIPQEEIRAGLISAPGFVMKHLGLYWDGLNTYWHDWVINYDGSKQLRYLRSLNLGIMEMKDVVLALAIAASCVIALLGLILILPRRKPQQDPIFKVYTLFCNKLEKLGVKRFPTEAPYRYAERVINLYPHLQHPVADITDAYVNLRYARATSSRGLHGLQQQVKAFVPRKKP